MKNVDSVINLASFAKMDKEAEKNEAATDDSTLARDQKQRGYYYDDAHGYEIYKPDEEDETDDAPPQSETRTK